MKSLDTIILSAGSINYSNLPIQTNTSNSMVPVNGKPVISWILDDLLSEGRSGRVVLVVREDDEIIQEFVQRVYKSRLDLKVVTIRQSESILHSLRVGLTYAQTKSVRLILGDTLVRDMWADHEHDFIYVQEVDDSSRWCLALLNDRSQPLMYIEKQPNVPAPHYAVCGYYVFGDSSFLLHQLDEALRSQKRQISDLLLYYQVKYPLTARFAKTWYDFGNADNFIHAKRRLLQGRFFNSLTIDPVLNTITKVSDLDQKLRNELNWYEQLPDKLKVLTPRIVSKEERDGKLCLTQEYYGYPTLSELLLFSNLSVESWESIFRTLLRIHFRLNDFAGDLDASEIRKIYYTKTFERIQKMLETGYEWRTLFSAPVLRINNVIYNGLPHYMKWLERQIEHLIQNTKPTIIHGDYCFSNILYDISSHIVRLIDPRGNFGRDGIYGDPRYDVAKLRHSVCGKYDYLIADLFSLEEEEASFIFDVYARPDAVTIEQKFDALISSHYDLNEIRLIEVLLFLSMIPYHQDKPKRQKAMFLTGIMRLSEINSENSY